MLTIGVVPQPETTEVYWALVSAVAGWLARSYRARSERCCEVRVLPLQLSVERG